MRPSDVFPFYPFSYHVVNFLWFTNFAKAVSSFIIYFSCRLHTVWPKVCTIQSSSTNPFRACPILVRSDHLTSQLTSLMCWWMGANPPGSKMAFGLTYPPLWQWVHIDSCVHIYLATRAHSNFISLYKEESYTTTEHIDQLFPTDIQLQTVAAQLCISVMHCT